MRSASAAQGQNGLFAVPRRCTAPVKIFLLISKSLDQLPNYSQLKRPRLGFYITGHPLGNYVDLLHSLKAAKSVELPDLPVAAASALAESSVTCNRVHTKRGDKFALLRLEDEGGGTKCVLWPETYRKHSALLQNELPVLVTGRLELSEDNPATVIVDQVQSLDDILKNQGTGCFAFAGQCRIRRACLIWFCM